MRPSQPRLGDDTIAAIRHERSQFQRQFDGSEFRM